MKKEKGQTRRLPLMLLMILGCPVCHEKAGKGHFLAVSFRLRFRFYFSNGCTNQLGLKMMTKTGSQTAHIFRSTDSEKNRGKLCPCVGVMASSSSPRCDPSRVHSHFHDNQLNTWQSATTNSWDKFQHEIRQDMHLIINYENWNVHHVVTHSHFHDNQLNTWQSSTTNTRDKFQHDMQGNHKKIRRISL